MTIEQKAKRYDETLKAAVVAHKDEDRHLKAALERIFLELKKSDEERIRKAIIEFFESEDDNTTYSLVPKKDILAWLEKQGKQNHTEQSKENIEPKFHEGEWIVFNGLVLYINKVVNGYYRTTNIDDIPYTYAWDIDNMARPWAINEAKDGDVLAVNNEVFIYAHRKQMYSIAVAHCFVDSASGFHLDGEFGYTEKGNSTHPATKEQRDTLMKAMTDAGYTFDFEKKELKKIESKFKVNDCVVVSTTEGDRVVQIASVEYSKDGHPSYFTTEGRWFGNETKARLLTDKDVETITLPESKIIVSQKPAEWSEEDESILQGIWDEILANKHNSKEYEWKAYDKFLDWLKSLKDRVQPKQEWSEEDIRNIDVIDTVLFYDKDLPENTCVRLRNWLKSLRPQPKKEWNEEDERTYKSIIYSFVHNYPLTIQQQEFVKSLKPQNNITDEELVQAKKDAYNDALDKIEYHSGEPTFDDGWSAAIDYIRKKYLRPQQQWKPTEAQLSSLTIACDRNDRIGFDLTQLLKELKKL